MNFENPNQTEKKEQQEMTPEKLESIFAKITDSEFLIKGGKETARPMVRKLYANKALREALLSPGAEKGEIEIMGVRFEVVNGRKTPDGKMASIVHQASQGLVERHLLKKNHVSEDEIGVEIPPLAEIQTGPFQTSAGDRFPKKNTIYATKLLRSMLGIKGEGGELEIEGEKYTIKTGRRSSDDVPYTNYTTKSVKEKLEKYIADKFDERYED